MILFILQILLPALALLGAAFITYRKDVKLKQMTQDMQKANSELTDVKMKRDVLGGLLNFIAFNKIRDSVDRIFEQTKADQFLILFAINGKTDFNYVTVIFEQQKESKYKINAIVRYRDVNIDVKYRGMLKDAETHGSVDLTTSEMSSQILKDFYTLEKIKHSKVHFIHRKSLDENNDVTVFGSVATHSKEKWSKAENTIIKNEYEGSINHILREFI